MPQSVVPSRPLIDRTLVAAALDRGNDGRVSREELAEAGITRVDDAAISVVNEPGEQGDAITVSELAKALSADRVAITSRGALTIEQGRAKMVDGVLQPAEPWLFPESADLRALEAFDRLIPRLGRYNPSWPDDYYVDRVFKGYERVKVGDRRVPDGKNSDGTTRYRSEPIYEDRAKYENEVQYDRLLRGLRRKAEEVIAATGSPTDPALRQALAGLQAVRNGDRDTLFGWGAERSSRDYYRALEAYDRIQKPTRPEVLVGRLDAALGKTVGAIDEQTRIAKAVPLERARQAIAAEASRLRGVTASNFVAGGLTAAAGGAAAFFLFGGGIAAAPLVGMVAGAALLAGGLAWGVVQLMKGGKAKGLEADLAVLAAIDPAANRKEAEQHALASYRLLQDARTADYLAALRLFEADAKKVETALAAVQRRAEAQTKSLKTVEGWVLKLAK